MVTDSWIAGGGLKERKHNLCVENLDPVTRNQMYCGQSRSGLSRPRHKCHQATSAFAMPSAFGVEKPRTAEPSTNAGPGCGGAARLGPDSRHLLPPLAPWSLANLIAQSWLLWRLVQGYEANKGYH